MSVFQSVGYNSTTMLTQGEITQLLTEWSAGDSDALERLMPVVFEDLHRMALSHFARESPGHTLQPTAVISEVYLKLLGSRTVRWQNRAQFFGHASRLMRRILVDHARARLTEKRGGQVPRIPLTEVLDEADEESVDLVALDDALKDLEILEPRQAKIIEMRFFGGLKVEEIAEFLEISPRTVKRNWRMARIWLAHRLNPP